MKQISTRLREGFKAFLLLTAFACAGTGVTQAQVKPTGITPGNGATIPELNTVTINWEQRYINLGEAKATISKDGGEAQDITDNITTANGIMFGGATSTIAFTEAYGEAGEYTITLPAGLFNLASNMMGTMEPSEEIVLTYTVTGEEVEHPAPEFTATPENGATVSELEEVRIQWGSSMLTENDGEITLQINGGEAIDISEFCKVDPGMEGIGGFYPGRAGSLSINFVPAYTEAGTYVVTIPAGYVTVKNASAPNGEIILTYEIESSGDNPGGGDNPVTVPTPTIKPSSYSTVESISQVTIDWGIEIEEGSLGQGWFSSVNVFRNGEYYSYATYEEIEGISVILYFDPEITEAGNYEIKIPEDYVYFPTLGDEVSNPELSIYYFIEGGNEEPSTGVKPTGINPENGATIPELNTVTINWEQPYITLGEAKATISKDGGEPQDITDYITTANGSYIVGAKATINFDGAFNEAGKYTITLPAGMFNLASNMMGAMEPSAEIVLTYTVTGEEVEHPAPAFTATPANGATVSELEEVRIQWGSSLLEEIGGKVTIQFNDNEPVEIEDEDCGFYAGTEGMWGGLIPGSPGNLTLWFNPPYTEAGTYTITVPEGYVYVKDASTVNGEIVLTYTITGEEFEEPTLKADPADKSEVESLETITLDWGTEIEEGENMGTWVSMVTILKDGEEYYDSVVDTEYVTFDNKVEIIIDPEITEPGEYQLVFPENYVIFTKGDCGNDKFTLTYTIKEGGEDPDQPVDPTPDMEYTVIPSNEEPVEELPEIVTILFGDRKESLNIIKSEGATLQIGENEPVDISENVMADYEEVGEGWDLEYLYFAAINLSDYVEDAEGNCTITLPEGFFNIGGFTIAGNLVAGEDSPEVVIVYVIDSTEAVRGINAETDGIYRVYNLNGMLVLSTENALDLNTLAKGIYIINGKKYILR